MKRKQALLGLSLGALSLACLVAPTPFLARASAQQLRTSNAGMFAAYEAAVREHMIGVATAWKNNAEARLPAAQGKLDLARSLYSSARNEGLQLTTEFNEGRVRTAEIEARLLAAPSADSAYVRAGNSLAQLRKKLGEERQRVLSSPAYQARYNAAKNSPDVAQRLPRIRSEALENDGAYLDTERKFRAAETIVGQARAELFAQDPEWTKIIQQQRQLVVQMGENNERMESYRLRALGASISFRSTAAIISMASATIGTHSSALAAAAAAQARAEALAYEEEQRALAAIAESDARRDAARAKLLKLKP